MRTVFEGQSWLPSWPLSGTTPNWTSPDLDLFSDTMREREGSRSTETSSHRHLLHGFEDSGGHFRRKRSLRMAEADDDEQSCSSSSKQRRFAASTSSSSENRLFACPYAKFDPARFSDKNIQDKTFRSCRTKLMRDISRVK
jgi:hypothetical protein